MVCPVPGYISWLSPHQPVQSNLNLRRGYWRTNLRSLGWVRLVTGAGAGFGSAPSVIFSTGAAAATAYLAQRRMAFPLSRDLSSNACFLMGPFGAPQTFYLSRPGPYFNFDISQPTRADDSISATLVSGTLNNIKAVIPVQFRYACSHR